MHSAADRFGVDVCLMQNELMNVPRCPHGPMLLFERFFKDGKPSAKFYACSACRDKKDCSFFQWEHEKISVAREKAHKDIIEATKPSPNQRQYRSELEHLFTDSKKDAVTSWTFCHSCKVLVLDRDKDRTHEDHEVVCGESLDELRHPSEILKPLENVKAQAQFLFSNKSTKFLVTLIKRLGFKKALCLGTPRIHEQIQLNRNSKGKSLLNSLLLDIDYRYGQFFPSNRFLYYNMFNHHFFDKGGEKVLLDFLGNPGDTVLIMDPPFGGLVEVLAASVQKFWKLWKEKTEIKDKKEMSTMWIFPYFMESHIQQSLPSLKMMDYKVDYQNHPHFKSKDDKGSKRGSPVRIFTNINPADIKLPSEEGYRLCKVCERYVSSENAHCPKCNCCSSKDGRQYTHCDPCGMCVKPGRVHCDKCNRCDLPPHDCERISSKGCHICGELGHKRKNCPTRQQSKRKRSGQNFGGQTSRKRKSNDLSPQVKKKKKTKNKLKLNKT